MKRAGNTFSSLTINNLLTGVRGQTLHAILTIRADRTPRHLSSVVIYGYGQKRQYKPKKKLQSIMAEVISTNTLNPSAVNVICVLPTRKR